MNRTCPANGIARKKRNYLPIAARLTVEEKKKKKCRGQQPLFEGAGRLNTCQRLRVEHCYGFPAFSQEK